MKKAGKLQILWLIIACFYQTAWLCTKGLWVIFRGKFTLEYERKNIITWSKKILKTMKTKVKIVNPDNIAPKRGEPTIIMCNHSSLFDIPISFLAFPEYNMRMLAKKELAKVPIFGQAMRRVGYPFIDRKNRIAAIQSLNHVKKLLNEGFLIWIAPEGTRSKDGKLQAFKKGGFITAIETNATIIPIGIRGAHNILPTKSFRGNLNARAELHIGKPVYTKDFTLENKDELIKVVRDSMKKLVGES